MTNESGEIDVTHVRNLDVTANPAALGLTAFGMTTVLLNLHNAGLFELGSMILAMGMFYGGSRPDYCRDHGVEEEQHVRDDRIHIFRDFLGDSCRPSDPSETRARGGGKLECVGGILCDVGDLYARHVHRVAQSKPGIAGCTWLTYPAVLPAGNR